MPKIKRTREPRGNKHNRNCVVDLFGSYKGADAFVMGTGTSLAGFDWTSMNDKLTIALNDAVKAPGFKPKFHIFCDVGIWARYRNMNYPEGCAMVCQKRARAQFLRWEHWKDPDQVFHFNHVSMPDQMTDVDDSLYVSRTVATGGITLAWKLGARRIFLLGVDGYKFSDRYYYDGSTKRPEKRREVKAGDGRISQDRHEWWRQNMNKLRDFFRKRNLFLGPWPKSGVYNLSPFSTIESWEKVPPKTVLGAELCPIEVDSEPSIRSIIYQPRKWSLPYGVKHRSEAQALFWSVEQAAKLKSPHFVEIGTGQGYTARGVVDLLARLERKSVFTSFDIQDMAGFWKAHVESAIKPPIKAQHLVFPGPEGVSLDWGDRGVAWVFVDGCYCHDCVRDAIEAWSPLVAPGGFLVFNRYRGIVSRRVGLQPYHGDPYRPAEVKRAVDTWLPKTFERVKLRRSLYIARRI
ncbi:MAG: class I SAM-dependent methyltransferase [Candidatus Latescibacterota bacterium]|nr:MAG: class I SAM-dependent methyltransferase [Candidatus Latescibacterota bacterium]